MMAGMPLIVAARATKIPGCAGGFFLLHRFEPASPAPLLFEQVLDLLLQLVERRIHLSGNGLDQLAIELHHVVSRKTGDCFNPAHARGNRALGNDAEEADLAGRAGVGTAAEFHGIPVQLPCPAADLDNADHVAVFVAEELHYVLARFDVRVGNFGPTDASVLDDAFVDELLDVGDLLRSERGAVEVEGQFVRADERAFLRGILAHDFVERPVEQNASRCGGAEWQTRRGRSTLSMTFEPGARSASVSLGERTRPRVPRLAPRQPRHMHSGIHSARRRIWREARVLPAPSARAHDPSFDEVEPRVAALLGVDHLPP